MFPGVSMFAYDVSPDGKQVVYATAGRDGKSQLWLAPDRQKLCLQTDRSTRAKHAPYFGPRGKILFQIAEGNTNYLERDESGWIGRAKVVPYPIIEIQGISPGRKWLMAIVPYSDGKSVLPMVMAIPLDGGPPLTHLRKLLPARHGRRVEGSFSLPVEAPSQTNPGRSLAIPIGPGESLPAFPPEGIEPGAEPDVVPGSQSVSRGFLVPGEDLSHFAYVNTTSHRNLYRISLP